MKNNFFAAVVLTSMFVSCENHDSATEKYQDERNKVVDVHKEVKAIDTGDVLIGSVSRMYVSDDYLIISDPQGYDKPIHLFDKSDFKHRVSVGDLGQGPYELTTPGAVGIDDARHKFYVSDYGKMRIFSYDMDSILLNPDYKHQVKVQMDNSLFPDVYRFVNDTVSYARVIKPTSASTFEQSIAKWNMKTGQIQMMEYTHPSVKNKRIVFDVSVENGFYVEGYTRHDLLTVCDLQGNLICNVYGPQWDGGDKSKLSCFGDVMIGADYIFATYSGGDYHESYFPTQLLVFDFTGNYIKTLDVGYKISDCCYDKTNNRIIMTFSDDLQFGYLDLVSVFP